MPTLSQVMSANTKCGRPSIWTFVTICVFSPRAAWARWALDSRPPSCAELARPNATVVCVTGDGSFMMMIHELATLHRYDLPVKIILFDNGCLGMVRQWQELFFANRESEIDLSDNPDFVQVARAFGIPSQRVDCNAAAPSAVQHALASDGPFLLHCIIERGANVWPLVAPNKANHEMMDPRLEPLPMG